MEWFAKAVAAVLLCAAVALGISAILSDAPMEEQPDEPQPTYELRVDCSNTAQMHRYGMPTKADVMQWHVHGQWGWIERGVLVSFAELPGSAAAWDELYGIEDNPAFDKHA